MPRTPTQEAQALSKDRKPVNTIQAVHNDHDRDISVLFKPFQTIEIIGKKIRFLAPSQIQAALLMDFIVMSIQDLVSTPHERINLSKMEVFEKCRDKLASLADESVPDDQKLMLVGAMFSNPRANELLLQAIKDCYPDVHRPECLTDEALMTMTTKLFERLFELISPQK